MLAPSTEECLETCVEIRYVAPSGYVRFKTDHTRCDDTGAVGDIRAICEQWERVGQFYVNRLAGTCRCGRVFRMRIPVHLVMEARLKC